jgi:hypothetical protein
MKRWDYFGIGRTKFGGHGGLRSESETCGNRERNFEGIRATTPPAAITLSFGIETAKANLRGRTAAVCTLPNGALPIRAYWQAVSARMGQRPPCIKGAKQVRNTFERPSPGRWSTVRNWPRPCKNAKVVYIEESNFFEAAK